MIESEQSKRVCMDINTVHAHQQIPKTTFHQGFVINNNSIYQILIYD